ncbi:MAG: sugar ABC transporter ATP-binding protein [Planctomycetes bacterium]|jgi:ribose transport system ATP-binding protein|nr:sugar ABC transporter ATP-binding protein [Planctomycetota bacterium]
MSPPRLAIAGVHKRFGPTLALAGVDLQLQAGEIHALIGENGAGKSTLLRVLGGIHAPDAGTMALDGAAFAPHDPAAARAAGIAVIHQELALAPHLSIAANLCLGREPRRGPFVDGAAEARYARAALARVGRAELPPDRRLSTLSPADRQLVEIARALAMDARVLVLDEPTSSLASADVAPLLQRLRELAAGGTTIVYVSHVFEELFAIAGRYTVLRDGASVATGSMAAATPTTLLQAMVGRPIENLYPRRPSQPGEVVLELDGLGGERLPRAASLQLRRGEVLGLAGLVGAGRTELLRAVFGLDAVRTGTVRVLGIDGAQSPRERWAQRVGLLSEDRKGEGLLLARSLSMNTLLPSFPSLATAGLLHPRAVDAASAPWLQRLGVRCRSPRQAAGELSGGNQQKVALARLFAADCCVLLLDEPTRGIDVGAKTEIYAAIDQRVRGEGKAALLVSSYLPELLGLCDRIAVVRDGIVQPARPVAELDQPTLLAAMSGLPAA